MQSTSLTSGVLMLWKAMADYNIDGQAVFEQVGLDPAMLHDPNARYPVDKIRKVWKYVVDHVNDSCFGLKVAEHFHPTTLHALGFAWLSSDTLEAAFNRLIRYSGLITDVEHFSFEQLDDEFQFRIHLPNDELYFPYEDYDMAFAIAVKLCRMSVGGEFAPKAVDMKRPEPEGCVNRFYEYFQSPINFNSSCYVLHFRTEDMTRPLPTANAELAQANEKIIMDYLEKMEHSDIVMRVRKKLIDMLPSGSISQNHVADALHMSERSLQRRLKENENSFKELLESTRKELARAYMDDSRLSINEITYLLGFSEPANFSRAFKRWVGVSPSEYRKKQASLA